MVTSSSRASESRAVEVAIIGSARIAHDDERYAEAESVGAAVAAAGWTLVTGGYGGLMGAASSAAAATGGHTVGLPMTAWEHLEPHASNVELRWSADYSERLRQLLAVDVVVALPGGVGTLSEASVVWAAAQTEPEAARLILVGEGWTDVYRAIASGLVVDASDLELARLVAGPEGVVPAVRELLSRPRRSPRARG